MLEQYFVIVHIGFFTKLLGSFYTIVCFLCYSCQCIKW